MQAVTLLLQHLSWARPLGEHLPPVRAVGPGASWLQVVLTHG